MSTVFPIETLASIWFHVSVFILSCASLILLVKVLSELSHLLMLCTDGNNIVTGSRMLWPKLLWFHVALTPGPAPSLRLCKISLKTGTPSFLLVPGIDWPGESECMPIFETTSYLCSFPWIILIEPKGNKRTCSDSFLPFLRGQARVPTWQVVSKCTVKPRSALAKENAR